MFRTQSPRPAAYVERRLTPRRGDGGTDAPARGIRAVNALESPLRWAYDH